MLNWRNQYKYFTDRYYIKRRYYKNFNKNEIMLFISFIVLAIVILTMIIIVLIELAKPYIIPMINQKTPKVMAFEATGNIDGIPYITDILPEGHRVRPMQKMDDVQYIVIHETGNYSNGADAAAHNNYIKHMNDDRNVSWHYTVDDTEIYNHIPDDEVAWHAGSNGNKNGIGIEICVNEDGDYEMALLNAAKLVANLLHKHGLEISNIKQHADFMSKNCPTILRDSNRWDKFLLMIDNEYKQDEINNKK